MRIDVRDVSWFFRAEGGSIALTLKLPAKMNLDMKEGPIEQRRLERDSMSARD